MADKVNEGAREVEEQYLLRVKDPALASALRDTLRGVGAADPAASKAQLLFESSDRIGQFAFGRQHYPLAVQDLPTVTESYRSYDGVNLVKTTDVGQVLVVGEAPASGGSAVDAAAAEAAGPSGVPPESRDGVTPPMRNARARLFRRHLDVDPRLVQKVEQDLLCILAGGAPEGVKFVDVEEEYRTNPQTGVGEWVPLQHASGAAAAPPPAVALPAAEAAPPT